MCGIAGLFLAATTDQSDQADLERVIDSMTNALAHRGPDGQRTMARQAPGYCGALGFRRLAILDVDERAMQPMHSNDAALSLVFNGEIYNFKQLRDELSPRDWKTSGDSEVVLAAYEKWGANCVERFRGMFAIAVVDWRNHTLFLARDRMGQKPLYVSRADGRIAFASELAALRRVPGFDASINQDELTSYLRRGYVSPASSIYAGTAQLAPGGSMVVDLASPRFAAAQRTFWRENQNPSATTQVVTPDTVRLHVERAVGEQLVSDVPLGVFLSGGIDSSIVALCARRLGPVKTFSIGFDDARYDESGYAREVAKHLGTEHHEFRATPDVIRDIARLARSFGEPFADSSAIPTRLLCEMTRQRVKVALSGDGGDELFAGYDRYRAMRLAARWGRFVPASLSGALSRLDRGHPKSNLTRLGRLMRSMNQPAGARYAAYTQVFDRSLIEELTGRPIATDWISDDDLFDGMANVVQACMRLDRKTYLPGDLLTKVDRCSMAHSLEVRSPFMDHELVEHVCGLGDEQLLRVGPKSLLRQAFAHELPASVFGRAKRGFAVPVGDWLRGELSDWMRGRLTSKSGFCSQQFSPKVVERLISQHQNQSHDHTARLWALCVLEEWHASAKI